MARRKHAPGLTFAQASRPSKLSSVTRLACWCLVLGCLWLVPPKVKRPLRAKRPKTLVGVQANTEPTPLSFVIEMGEQWETTALGFGQGRNSRRLKQEALP